MTTEDQRKLLEQPMDPGRIRTREQGGVTLSYIESWDAIATGNRIFGFGEWATRIDELVCVGSEERTGRNAKPCWAVAYRAIVGVTALGTTFQDVGFGNDISYKSELDAHELASKEAVSDAEKRCLRHYGDQFGLCLYDKEQKGVGEPEPAAEEKPKRAPRKRAAPSKVPQGRSDDKDPAPGLEEASNKSIVAYMQFCIEKGGASEEAVNKQLNAVTEKYGLIPQEWVDHMTEQAKLQVRMRDEKGK